MLVRLCRHVFMELDPFICTFPHVCVSESRCWLGLRDLCVCIRVSVSLMCVRTWGHFGYMFQ